MFEALKETLTLEFIGGASKPWRPSLSFSSATWNLGVNSSSSVDELDLSVRVFYSDQCEDEFWLRCYSHLSNFCTDRGPLTKVPVIVASCTTGRYIVGRALDAVLWVSCTLFNNMKKENNILTFFLSFLHLLHGLLFLLSPFILLEGGGLLLICGRFINNSRTQYVKPILSKRCTAASLPWELPSEVGDAKYKSISRWIPSSLRKLINFWTADCPAWAKPQDSDW